MTEGEYLIRERECIAEYDGNLTREQAETLARQEAEKREEPQRKLFRAG
jgi:hypothetical protein